MKDTIVCYFDNCDELLKYTKRPVKKIVYSFNCANDFIVITIDKKEYKLYTFVDEKKEISSFFFCDLVRIKKSRVLINLSRRLIMNLKYELLENQVSQKGNTYNAIKIIITDKCYKLAFLTNAELELFKQTYHQNK